LIIRKKKKGGRKMKIELWSDFACPFCYIGKKRFENALNKFPHKDEVELSYKAYQLNPNAPKEMKGTAYEAFAKGHGTTPEQAKQKFAMFTENAKTVGLEYNYDIIQMTNTFDAHRLAKYANTLNLEQELTDRFMKAYFTDGENLSDFDTLTRLASEVGLEKRAVEKVLEENQYADLVKEQMLEGRQVGVRGVPFFVLNRKYGVSGAQQEEYFTQVLEKLWEEEQESKLSSIGNTDQGATCNDETCEF
jgi:predicted DsbA family dithiol-disulfide isomerase